jgi:hypothetical protein
MSSAFKLALAVTLATGVAMCANIPAGTQIRIRLGQTISSAKAKAGDNWGGTLSEDLKSGGKTLAKKGAPVRGKVVEAQSSGRLSGKAEIALQLTSVTIGGTVTPVVTGSVSEVGGGHTKRNAGIIGGVAAAGAVIGGIAGGGSGAAIGAGAGAGAGTVGAAATGKKDISFPVESILTFVAR